MTKIPTTVSREDYDLCEKENANLRAILAWVVPLLFPQDREELAVRLDQTIKNGGVTKTNSDDIAEQLNEQAKLFDEICNHFENTLDTGVLPKSREWHVRASYLLNKAREYTPKHPLMRRVGDYPNVYAPVALDNKNKTVPMTVMSSRKGPLGKEKDPESTGE